MNQPQSFCRVMCHLADLRLSLAFWPAWLLWLTPDSKLNHPVRRGNPSISGHCTHTHTHMSTCQGLRKLGFCTACLWNWFPLAPLGLLTFHWCSSVVRGSDVKQCPSQRSSTQSPAEDCNKCVRVCEREEKQRQNMHVCQRTGGSVDLLHSAMMWLLSSWTNFFVTASSIICFTCAWKQKRKKIIMIGIRNCVWNHWWGVAASWIPEICRRALNSRRWQCFL